MFNWHVFCRGLFGLLPLAFLFGCGSQPVNVAHLNTLDTQSNIEQQQIKLASTSEEFIVRASLAANEEAQNSMPMQYYANSGAEFAAGVLTHFLVNGAITGSADRARKQEENLLAVTMTDLIPATQLSYLNGVVASSMGLSGAADTPVQLVESSSPDMHLVTEPVVLFRENESSIWLQNQVILVETLPGENILYQNVIELSGAPGNTRDLYGESLAIALKDIEGGWDSAPDEQQTIIYAGDNGTEYERGQLLEQHCGYLLFRTLRGWMKRVPQLASKEETASC